jgi:hypothetical protein
MRLFASAPQQFPPNRLALGTPSGRLKVLAFGPGHPTGSVLAETPDLGVGGSALCIRPAPGQSGTDLFFGTLVSHAPAGSYATGTLNDASVIAPTLVWYRYSESAGAPTWTLMDYRSLNPTSGDRGCLGVSGMALGDLLGGPEEELVVTTMSGDLFVYSVGASSLSAAPAFRTWFGGAGGAYGSLFIGDLDPTATGSELYLAGSIGIRKWRRP